MGSFHRAKCQDLKHLSVETTNCAFIWAQDQFPVRRCHKLAGFFHGFHTNSAKQGGKSRWILGVQGNPSLPSWIYGILGAGQGDMGSVFCLQNGGTFISPKPWSKETADIHMSHQRFVSHTSIATIGDRWGFRILYMSSLFIYTYITHGNSRAQNTTKWYLNDIQPGDCICHASKQKNS